jgi:hypothetical protein
LSRHVRRAGQGRGNPALRSHNPEVPAQITAAREQTRMATLLPSADTWLTRDDLTK